MEWLEWAEPIAYGPLNLKPWEFEELTPHEFMMMFDGYLWRKDRQMETFALFTCHLLNVSGKILKKEVTVNDLLSRKVEKRNRVKDEAELKEIFKRKLKGGKR